MVNRLEINNESYAKTESFTEYVLTHVMGVVENHVPEPSSFRVRAEVSVQCPQVQCALPDSSSPLDHFVNNRVRPQVLGFENTIAHEEEKVCGQRALIESPAKHPLLPYRQEYRIGWGAHCKYIDNAWR